MTTTWSSPPRHPILGCAEQMERSLKSVADVQPGFMSTAEKQEALTACTRLEAELESLKLRVVAPPTTWLRRPAAGTLPRG